MTQNEMLTRAEVARRLRISQHLLKELIEAGEIKTFQPHPNAKRRRIWSSEIDRYREGKQE